MARIIGSPVRRWPGKIVIASPLNWGQYSAWKASIEEVSDGKPDITNAEMLNDPRLVQKILPGVLACVERWELGGDFPPMVDAGNFPATPRDCALKVLMACVGAIGEVVTEEDSEPPPLA